MLKKNITVYTNDPANPTTILTITGQVDKLYTLSPSRIRLVGFLGTEIKQTIKFVAEEKYPLNLLAIRAKHGDHLQYKMVQLPDEKTATYEITVTNTREEAGRFIDTLFLKTDSEIKPEINVSVYGFIKPKPDNTKK